MAHGIIYDFSKWGSPFIKKAFLVISKTKFHALHACEIYEFCIWKGEEIFITLGGMPGGGSLRKFWEGR